MANITPTAASECASGINTLANLFRELPKTQAIGIAIIIATGALVAIDIATSRGYDIELDWPNKRVTLTRASATT
jgi:hypothetical protein